MLPISAVHSSFEATAGATEAVLLPFEYAKVFFHEFGNALHMLLSRALPVAWQRRRALGFRCRRC